MYDLVTRYGPQSVASASGKIVNFRNCESWLSEFNKIEFLNLEKLWIHEFKNLHFKATVSAEFDKVEKKRNNDTVQSTSSYGGIEQDYVTEAFAKES